MIDLFTIFSKGGLVLVWYIQNGADNVTKSVNSLIKSIVLQDKISKNPYNHELVSLQYYMDNQFDLVYVVAYQSVLELSYTDKFLTAIALEFRDKYKNVLESQNFLWDFSDFVPIVDSTFLTVKNNFMSKPKKEMISFQESYKAAKTLKSMTNENIKHSKIEKSKITKKKVEINDSIIVNEIAEVKNDKSLNKVDEESLESKLAKIAKTRGKKMKNGISKKKPSPTDSPIIETISKKVKGKENRKWTNEATGIEADALNYSKKIEINGNKEDQLSLQEKLTVEDLEELNKLKGRLEGQLADIEAESDLDSSEGDDEEYQKEIKTESKPQKKSNGMFSMLKSWVGVHGGVLTEEQMCPVLENLKNHLITKNVASEVAMELCNGVAKKLVGKELGVLERVSTKLRESLEDSCRKLLNCGRRIDVLRDVIEARRQGRPYVISFCGVNGVGKSTNLAKISFWLIEQGFRVMIAACDTFRSGAVEQLRVHVQKLNYIHPPEQHHGLPMVQLYEKGYGKDAAAVATYAISLAKEKHFDVVMIDTSGRMQDNEPLMRSLAKLINVNQPDLVLFVGEALVGHEAVDQLVKFNKALMDYSGSDHPRTINGIVLTKFDTIDDKVGAAISMTYILGQPIMFVGTGQTYADLRQLSPEAVVKSLMK